MMVLGGVLKQSEAPLSPQENGAERRRKASS
jgi:hypothetical protein